MPFANSFSQLPTPLWQSVEPELLLRPRMACVNANVQESIGEPISSLTNEELLAWLSGTRRIAGDQRISTCYSGHQFGVWAGQLGDGRALSLGEFTSPDTGRLEVQVKGLGKTPYSRMGDGRAVIRSSVREFLCAEYMHALGIPTTRSLALIVSDTPVQRETLERGAVVARVFPTQIRFGHFEFLYHSGKHRELAELITYVREKFMPGFESIETWFTEVVKRTAHLLAHWQSVGFCHGVMNTDNMSILGLTLDYGPFGFMERFDPNYVCNHSDHEGRYSYGNQPRVGLWNLQCLASCLLPFVDEDALRSALDTFEPALTEKYRTLMTEKLGLEGVDGILPLVADLLVALEQDRIDYHFFFRCLCDYQPGKAESLNALWQQYPEAESVRTWLNSYSKALEAKTGLVLRSREKLLGRNPALVLRNYIAQEIIEHVERDDFMSLNQWLKALQNPFISHDEASEIGVYNFSGYELPVTRELGPISCSS